MIDCGFESSGGLAHLMFDQAKALQKFVLSFRKHEWTIDDYPLKVTDHGPVEAKGRLKPSRWTAQIINWLQMRGDADTREGALLELQHQFDEHLREWGSLPRPGAGRKLEVKFAAADRVEANDALVADIVRRVIGMEPENCFVSDESTLWDFHHEEDNAEYIRKILLLYQVDVSDLDPPFLWAIAERIGEQRAG
jgi:hypothetical protein